MRKILKAEILITRRCNLHCSYCNITKNMKEMSTEDWFLGFEVLKSLGCSIAPIYGAEPLMAFDKLVDIVQFADDINLPTTVITNCGLLTKKRMSKLYDKGLRSLTVSVDSLHDNFFDDSSRLKTFWAIDRLRWFYEEKLSCKLSTLTVKLLKPLS